MGIQINGQTDTISATDGSFTISGASGNLTGNLTGNVTGNLTGDVTGNLTGTASTASNLAAGATLVIGAGSTSAPSLAPSGDSNTGIFFPSADTIAFAEGGAEASRIDSSGRLLVGHTDAVYNLKWGGSGDFPRNSYIYSANKGLSNGFAILNYDATTTIPSILTLGSSRNDTPGNNGLTSAGETIASISFQGSDTTRFIDCARIDAGIDNTDGVTSGTNDMPGYLRFNLTSDGGSVVTERLQICHDGRCHWYSDAYNHIIRNNASAGTTYYFITGVHSATGAQTGGTASFRVWTNGDVQNTNNSYDAISDIKLKENIVDAPSQWDDLKAIQIRKYNFKEETGHETHTQLGVIAQEIENVSPGIVGESPDIDAEGNILDTTTKSVKYSVLYMKAVKALQEAMERIEILEAKVSALEGQ